MNTNPNPRPMENSKDASTGSLSRRRFLTAGLGMATLGGLSPLVVPRHVLGGEGYQAPSDTLRIAAVGIGGMGQHYLAGCKGERVVALAKLDETRLNPVKQESMSSGDIELF